MFRKYIFFFSLTIFCFSNKQIIYFSYKHINGFLIFLKIIPNFAYKQFLDSLTNNLLLSLTNNLLIILQTISSLSYKQFVDYLTNNSFFLLQTFCYFSYKQSLLSLTSNLLIILQTIPSLSYKQFVTSLTNN